MPSHSIFRRLFLLAVIAVSAVILVDATQVMHRPDRYKEAPNRFTIERDPKTNVIQRRQTNGKVSFAYFTNWGIYGANFQPTDLKPAPLTHILYSFADTDSSSGAIKLTDPYADEQKRFAGDTWDEVGNNLYGCLKQLYLLKLKQRNLKVLLSIGGWTYSQAGHFNFVTSAAARATFVSNAVQLVEDYGFDGIDIDFEYPATSAQGQGLADLVTSLRVAFDGLASKKGDKVPYLITAAVAAGPLNYANLKVPQMNSAMNFWNVMAYDYAGSWLTFSDNQANLYGGVRTGFQTDSALTWYKANGAPANKLVMGIPLYGRAFENTNGLGQPFQGIGPGTIEAGIYSYKALPLAGSQIFENSTDVTSYSYDAAKKELVSYDTPNIARMKAQYINSKGLAGSMFWELSTDKTGSESLVNTVTGVLGALDQTQNHISFPSSKWDNIRSNMGGTTPTPPTTTTPRQRLLLPLADPAPVLPHGSLPPTHQCIGSHLWTAKWWTQNETPGGASGVWTDNGAC
ncbi:glycoside hydrolase family 18 protein [Crassisporium funariophilum]|nr:glycoside hydrolase family 18 protein [Crassisporium funariophilum]